MTPQESLSKACQNALGQRSKDHEAIMACHVCDRNQEYFVTARYRTGRQMHENATESACSER